MKRLYTAESVTEGHPDKVCDRIADTILDACLAKDPEAHVACEVLATKGTVLLAGEISSSFEPDVLSLAEEVVGQVGYDPKAFLFDALIHKQSPDIAGGVQKSREKRGNPAADEEWSMGAGDQGIMTGYACRETPQMLPMPVVLANRIVRELDAARKSGFIKGILPDGKAQVTVEYEDHKPVRLDTVIVSCQHEEEKTLKELEREIRQKVLKPALHLLPADGDTKSLRAVCCGRHGSGHRANREKADGRCIRKCCSPRGRRVFRERRQQGRPLWGIYGEIYCKECCGGRACGKVSGNPCLRNRHGAACDGAGGYLWDRHCLCG